MEAATVGGVSVPKLGLGTYRLRGDACRRAVEKALSLGYRHIDTAEYYENQAAIGDAIEASDVSRDELFLTTKVWRTNLSHEEVLRSARESVTKLGVETVDLLLIHWPSRRVPVGETLSAMNQLQDEGVVRHVGVSNFSVDQLDEARAESTAPILTDQVRYHPYSERQSLLEYCIAKDVVLTAYSPLAKGRVTDDETLQTIGERYEKTPAQVALRWLVQQENVVAIPKASSRSHLEENLDIFDFSLSVPEMETVFDLQGGLLQTVRDALGI